MERYEQSLIMWKVWDGETPTPFRGTFKSVRTTGHEDLVCSEHREHIKRII